MFIKTGDVQPIISIIDANDVADVVVEDAKAKMKKVLDAAKKKGETRKNAETLDIDASGTTAPKTGSTSS